MSTLRKTVFGLFFLSGFCGLLYQVVWMRLALAHFGVITPVLSVVVSVFMLGLALGSWAGGAWISRAGRRISPAYAYAITEGLIGISAFVVPRLYAVGESLLLPGGEMNSAAYLVFSALIIAFAILPWCILMGATFPLMMAFIEESEAASETSFSFLYLANVIGAMCGTILTADVLVEVLGFRHTLRVAGFLNFLIAALSVVLGRRYSVRRTAVAVPDPVGSGAVSRSGAAWTTFILFVTGFTSMSLEVIWVRDFTPVVGTTVYAFALIVATYLLATWLGSSLYRRHLPRQTVWPTPVLLAALAAASLLTVAINDPRLHMKQAGVLIGIFPFSFLLGYLTPRLIDWYSEGDPDRAGRAYAVNIIGCILGPLVASYIFLPSLGAKFSMIAMAVPYVALFVVEFGAIGPLIRASLGLATAALLIGGIFFNRSYEEQYPDGEVRRDATATVISLGTGQAKRLLVNGVGITELTTITKVMAHLPLAMLEKPRMALDICFGMGTTYRALLRWPDVKVTAVELVPSVRKAFTYYHADAAAVLANPNGKIVIDDGRRFLRRSRDSFDVITIDPPPPIEAAGSSLLYTREFYQQLKQRLSPNGILQQWFPGGPGVECQAIARSLTREFPYVRAYGSVKGWGIHFFASMQPVVMPPVDVIVARMPEAAKKDLLEWEPGADPKTFMTQVLSKEIPIKDLLAGDGRIEISDDRPYNEYYLLRRWWAHYQRTGTL